MAPARRATSSSGKRYRVEGDAGQWQRWAEAEPSTAFTQTKYRRKRGKTQTRDIGLTPSPQQNTEHSGYPRTDGDSPPHDCPPHRPARKCKREISRSSHAKRVRAIASKCRTAHRLCEEVSRVVRTLNLPNGDLSRVGVVPNEEPSTVDMPRTCRGGAIYRQEASSPRIAVDRDRAHEDVSDLLEEVRDGE